MKQTRLNNSAVWLLSTISALMISGVFLLKKFSSFVTHTFYYCESVVRSLSWQVPNGLVLFIGSVFCVLFLITGAKLFFVLLHAIHLKKKVISYRLNPLQKKALDDLDLERKVQIINHEKPHAFCFGLFRPHIYVSSGLLKIITPIELETILRHEKYHLDSHDPLIILAIYSIQHFFPFFPLLSDLIRNYRIERELRADQAAIEGRGESDSLVSVLRKLLIHEHEDYAFAPAIADEDTLEARINALIHQNYNFSTFHLHHIVLSICSIGILSTIFFIPVQANETQNMPSNAVMKCYYSNERPVHQLNKSVPYSSEQ